LARKVGLRLGGAGAGAKGAAIGLAGKEKLIGAGGAKAKGAGAGVAGAEIEVEAEVRPDGKITCKLYSV